MQLPRIGITLGDAAGIGPEILAKLLAHEKLDELCIPVVIGDNRVVEQALASRMPSARPFRLACAAPVLSPLPSLATALPASAPCTSQ